MISVCFRFDDPSAISDGDLERRIIALFAQFRVPLCVAAIPFARTQGDESVPLSPENAPHLIDASKAGVIDVALHGHSHIHRGADTNGAHSEFAGVAKAEQARLIGEGAAHMAAVFGRRVDGFVPPWNSYDLNTAHVLNEAGFEYLSAGWEVFQSGTLPVIPRTCTLRNARHTLRSALGYQSLSPLLVVVFHPDDFSEFKYPPLPNEPPPFTNLDELESLLAWIATTPGIEVVALRSIAASIRHGPPLRNPAHSILPDRIKAELPSMLTRSGAMKTAGGVLWGALRTRLRLNPRH